MEATSYLDIRILLAPLAENVTIFALVYWAWWAHYVRANWAVELGS